MGGKEDASAKITLEGKSIMLMIMQDKSGFILFIKDLCQSKKQLARVKLSGLIIIGVSNRNKRNLLMNLIVGVLFFRQKIECVYEIVSCVGETMVVALRCCVLREVGFFYYFDSFIY